MTGREPSSPNRGHNSDGANERLMHGSKHQRLSATRFGFWVDVTVLSHEHRWLAVAKIAGDLEIGVGHTRKDAIRQALTSLGPEATDFLLGSTTVSRRAPPSHE